MRFSLFVLLLSAFISGCSSTSSNLDFSLEDLSLDTTQKEQITELDSLLAKDVKSRDLLRAKHLVSELKESISEDHSRYKGLVTSEQWINESLEFQTTIKSLQSKIANQNKALEQVRRTLVSE